MRLRVALLMLMGVLLLPAAVPAMAAAGYSVYTKSGRTVGRVTSSDDLGTVGVVRNRGGAFRGGVYPRQTSSGYSGWPVSNGSGYVAWVAKGVTGKFLVKKAAWGSAVGRVTRTSSGRWLAQRKSGGRWVTIGRVQSGCPGQWAAGAARLLLWSR